MYKNNLMAINIQEEKMYSTIWKDPKAPEILVNHILCVFLANIMSRFTTVHDYKLFVIIHYMHL